MLKVGIMGVGHLGKYHLNALKEIDGFEVVGFYDPDDKNAEEVIKDYSLNRYFDPQQLINDVQVIDVVTPTSTHYELARQVLRQSKHLFIEKPLTQSLEEAETLMKIGKEANVKIQVGHVERFNPAFIQARSQINQPMFIEAHRLAQFNPRGTDVPVVLDLMIHDIDIVLAVVKSNIRNISASGVKIISNTPDIANARLEFTNGCVANLTASRISMKNMRKARIFQSNAYISVDFLKKATEIITMKDISEGYEPGPLSMVIDGNNGSPDKEICVKKIKADEGNAIKSELSSFYASIIENKTPEVSILQAYEALKIATEIVDKIK